MNRAMPFLAAVAHLAACVWLLPLSGRLFSLLLAGDAGAGLVLVLGCAVIAFGARTTGAVGLVLAAHLVSLVDRPAARLMARFAVALSPLSLRASMASSAAGLMVLGSAAWSPALAIPATPAAPAWPIAEAAASAPEQSPGWPVTEERAPGPENSPGWPVSKAPAPAPEDTPAWPTTPQESEEPDDAQPDSEPPGSELPDSEQPGTEHADSTPEPPSIVVEAGDTLWSIATDLNPTAGTGQLSAAVNELYSTNRDRIGPDPHLIIPGLRLETP